MKAWNLACLVVAFCSATAWAFGDCDAQALKGKWSCDNSQTFILDVGSNQGIYELKPTASLGVPIYLDGKEHDLNVNGMSLTTQGSCERSRVSFWVKEGGQVSLSEEIAVERPDQIFISAEVGGQTTQVSCKKR